MTERCFRRYRFPLQFTDDLTLQTVHVKLDEEDALLDIIDALQKARKITTISAAEFDEEFVGEAALRELEALVSTEGTASLREILMAYATRKRFFADVEQEALKKQYRRIESAAHKLLAALEDAEWARANSRHDERFLATLARLTKIRGTISSPPDIDRELADDLFQWWQDVVGKEPSFWSNPIKEEHSPFIRFVSAALSLLPEEFRPTVERGTAGFARHALQRKFDEHQQQQTSHANALSFLTKFLSKNTADGQP